VADTDWRDLAMDLHVISGVLNLKDSLYEERLT
jgi:hypothetical protein